MVQHTHAQNVQRLPSLRQTTRKQSSVGLTEKRNQ